MILPSINTARIFSTIIFLLLRNIHIATAQTNNHGVTFLYPTAGITFSYLDTLNVSYLSPFPTPLLYTFCSNGNVQISVEDVNPCNSSALVLLNFTSTTPCYFDLRPNTSAGYGANSPSFTLLSSLRSQTTLGLDAGSSSTSSTSSTTSTSTTSAISTSTSGSSNDTTSDSKTKDDAGLSSAAKAGLGIGIALVALLVILAGLWFLKRKTRKSKEFNGIGLGDGNGNLNEMGDGSGRLHGQYEEMHKYPYGYSSLSMPPVASPTLTSEMDGQSRVQIKLHEMGDERRVQELPTTR